MTGPLTEFERMMLRILLWSQIIGTVIGGVLLIGKMAARALA